MSERTETCGSCRAWVPYVEGGNSGLCHSRPPNHDSDYPETLRLDWCVLDYQPREAAQPAPGQPAWEQAVREWFDSYIRREGLTNLGQHAWDTIVGLRIRAAEIEAERAKPSRTCEKCGTGMAWDWPACPTCMGREQRGEHICRDCGKPVAWEAGVVRCPECTAKVQVKTGWVLDLEGFDMRVHWASHATSPCPEWRATCGRKFFKGELRSESEDDVPEQPCGVCLRAKVADLQARHRDAWPWVKMSDGRWHKVIGLFLGAVAVHWVVRCKRITATVTPNVNDISKGQPPAADCCPACLAAREGRTA